MLSLQTPVTFASSKIKLTYSSTVMVLGSCFADNIGRKLLNAGFNAMVNPFGTLYNPVSICNAIARIASNVPFREDECLKMGAGSDLYCTLNHHTGWAREDIPSFLDNANSSLAQAHEHWMSSDIVLITLGTASCFKYKESGEVVANCLKLPASRFEQVILGLNEVSAVIEGLVCRYPEKGFIFTVSPVRYMSLGAHTSQISKSTLLLALDRVSIYNNCQYFPAYEIFMDELRDYRFYAEDMIHPSEQSVQYIWQRFCEFAVPEQDMKTVSENEKVWRQAQHRPLARR